MNFPTSDPYYQRQREIAEISQSLSNNVKDFANANEENLQLQQKIQTDLVDGIRNIYEEGRDFLTDPVGYLQSFGERVFYGRNLVATGQSPTRDAFTEGQLESFQDASTVLDAEGLRTAEQERLREAARERLAPAVAQLRAAAEGEAPTVFDIATMLDPRNVDQTLQQRSTPGEQTRVPTIYDLFYQSIEDFERDFQLEGTVWQGVAGTFLSTMNYELTEAIVSGDWSNLGQAFPDHHSKGARPESFDGPFHQPGEFRHGSVCGQYWGYGGGHDA